MHSKSVGTGLNREKNAPAGRCGYFAGAVSWHGAKKPAVRNDSPDKRRARPPVRATLKSFLRCPELPFAVAVWWRGEKAHGEKSFTRGKGSLGKNERRFRKGDPKLFLPCPMQTFCRLRPGTGRKSPDSKKTSGQSSAGKAAPRDAPQKLPRAGLSCRSPETDTARGDKKETAPGSLFFRTMFILRRGDRWPLP